MSRGSDALQDTYAKLDWATKRHDDLQRAFAEFAQPHGDDERPLGIHFHERPRPAGLVIARFVVERPLPTEMRLLAADLVHNTRVALDHILARLKDHFGGDPSQGSFPTWQTEERWRAKTIRARTGALAGLDQAAIELIYDEQPLHREAPAEDPLVILTKLDNTDKHRLLHQSFVYLGMSKGVDLIDILDRGRVRNVENLWRAGQPLENGTALARFMIRGDISGALRARPSAQLTVASGEVGAPSASYTSLIARVRSIADNAAELIDQELSRRT